MSSEYPWAVLPVELSISGKKKGGKCKGNGHNIRVNFVLAVTFEPMQIFHKLSKKKKREKVIQYTVSEVKLR